MSGRDDETPDPLRPSCSWNASVLGSLGTRIDSPTVQPQRPWFASEPTERRADGMLIQHEVRRPREMPMTSKVAPPLPVTPDDAAEAEQDAETKNARTLDKLFRLRRRKRAVGVTPRPSRPKA